jgi:hypothetical protein
MHQQNFILWKDQPRENRIAAIAKFLTGLALNHAWEVTVKPHQKKRSQSQNNYLWGAVYPTILKAGREELGGWTAEDLHEYFLGSHFGTEVLRFQGRDYVDSRDYRSPSADARRLYHLEGVIRTLKELDKLGYAMAKKRA